MGTVKPSEYFKHYRARTVAVLVLLQFLIVVTSVGTAWALWQYAHTDILEAAGLGMLALFLLQIVLASTLVSIASKPLKILAQAIAHVSKDAFQTPPPQVRGKSYEKSGLKELVKTVYALAAAPAPIIAPTNGVKTSSSLQDAIMHNAPCGIIALGTDGKVIFSNPLAPIQVNPAGQHVVELLFEQSNQLDTWLADCRANKVRDTKVWHRISDRLPEQEGRKIFDVIAYYEKGAPAGIDTVIVTIDRTSEYAPADEDMDFIALAAHELRGPITVIRGYLELLDQELVTILQPDQQQLIDRLQVSAERLSGYINNILNVSRYDRNHLQLHLREERLIDIIKNLVPDLALRAKTQNRRLTFYVSDALPTIAADRSSLSEVISNLIDNAIKYSHDAGEVVISAIEKGSFVEVNVQDFGIGMPQSVVGNLFSKFYRSHRSRQQVSGTGLGLYICKAIVESHGGSIWVTSTEGAGSTFGFSLPIYATVADKLAKGDNSNEQIIERSEGWIKNHAMYRR